MNRYRSPGNYGFSNYVDRALIDQMEANGVLRRVAWPIESIIADLYEVNEATPRE